MAYPAEIERIRKLPYGLKGFEAFCRLLRLEDGSAFRLRPFQRVLIGLYFAGVTELVIIMPKKNGKTTLMAALALYHLLMTPAAECVIGAASEHQAAILHRQARTMVIRAGLDRRAVGRKTHEHRTEYEGVFDVLQGIHEIRFELGRIRVLSCEGRVQGPIPSLALVDEYHEHPHSGLYAAFRDGLLGGAQMVTITNPGVSFDSPLGRLREGMLEYRCVTAGRRRQFSSPDGSVVLVEWGLEPDDDTDDLRIVKMANPAPWQTMKALRRRRDSPSMTRAEWLRYACGLWSAGDDAAVSGPVWERARDDIGAIRPGDKVVLVPSVGHNAAIGIASLRHDGRVAVKAEVLDPVEGASILERTERRLEELYQVYDVREIQHPVGAFIRSADILAGKGLPMSEAAHSPIRLTAATGTFDRLLNAGLLGHDGDPVLRDQVLAGRRKVQETGERFEITDRARALVAIAFAVHGVTAADEPTPRIHILQQGAR
jgi:phage terminase large subunit-like protein